MRVGLDVGGTKIDAVALREDDTIAARVRSETGMGTEAVTASIFAALAALGEHLGESATISSIGVGIPGIIAPGSGRVIHALNLDVAELDLAALLRAQYACPVAVENDVKAATVGAAHLRHGARSMAYLNLGTGVAAGILSEGRLWQGAHGAAGEIGHIAIDPQGPECSCGQRGCIEALCGGGPVARAWGRPGQWPIRDLFDAADAGDAEALRLRGDLVRAAAAAIRILALTTDVERVVVGGGLTAIGARLTDAVAESLRVEGARSGFLTSLRLEDRVQFLPPDSLAAAIGAALIGQA